MEFGVYEGHSTRLLRRALGRSDKLMFACDSFEGLPEKYEGAEVGTFECEPPKIRGVEIVKGYFEDSLTPELAARVKRVAFASLDADLYSSTICVLRWLTPLLGTGSLLLFDEFLGEQESERRAFDEWSQETGIQTVKIAEFMRVPAAWGRLIDSRPVFQVLGPEPIPQPRPPLKHRLLTSRPANVARRVRNRLRGRT
jgi:hypothetical protein